jgi:hypothetical protein
MPLSGIFKPSSSYALTPDKADKLTNSDVDSPISQAESTAPNHDVDVFRDDDSVKAFANQTYQSAREKYF